MFRKVSLKGEKSNDKLILMKNSREEFGEIPIEYTDEITYEFMQPSELKLTIPNKTTHNGQTVDNHIFDKILGKRQQMKFNEHLFVITDCDRSDTKSKKNKTVTAKSYDVTLEDSYLHVPMGGMMRHLVKRDNEYETADGYLDLFIQENPIWSIGHIDESCRTEYNKVNVEQDRVINNINIDNVNYDSVLFNQSFSEVVPIDNNSTVGVRISFREMECYDPITNKLLNTQTKVCDLGLFHIGIINIKATFINTDAYRYAINFEVTLSDNTIVSRVCEFVDIKEYNVRCSKAVMLFTDGTEKTVSMLKYRNLEENIYSWRSVMVDYISESFDCFVIFDNKNMTVNVYDKKTFGENKGLYLSYDNFVKGINKKYQYDNIVTKLTVESDQEGLSITDENPLGTDFLLNFDYFINNGIMSDECSKAWRLYESRIDGVQEGLYTLRVELNTKNSLKIKLETEMATLEETIKGLEAIRVGYVKEGDEVNATRLSREINAKYDRVKEIIKELSVIGDDISSIKKQIQTIVNSIDMSKAIDESGNKIFSNEDLVEIQNLTIPETYTDKYYLTNYGLYNNSKEILKERNKLQIDFNVDLVGLLQNLIIPNGLKWDYYIKIGDKINLEDDEINGDIRITKITYYPKDYKISSITFTNKDKEIDDLKSIGNVGRTISKVDTLTNTYKPEWKKGINVNKYVSDMLNYGLNLKATGIRSKSYSVKTDFSESGLFVIDANNENKQIFLAGGIIGITPDRFETLKVCIDTDGVIAETIVGKMLIGQNLIIANENNSMVIDKDGISIEANALKIKGIEGSDYTFQSYFEMVKGQIELGVKDSNAYTDAQIKIVDQKIQLKTSREDVSSIIQQEPESVKIGFNGISDNVVISPSGMNINGGGLTVTNSNGTVVIDGSSNMFKIKSVFEVQLNAGNNLQYEYRIRHGMGYVPAYSAFQVGSESFVGLSNTMLPALNVSLLENNALGFVGIIRANADENDIIITYVRASANVYNNPRIKVFVYKEALI